MGGSCPAGQTFDPRVGCECVDANELKSKLYPDWATDEDIRNAVRAAWENAGAQSFDSESESDVMQSMISAIEDLLTLTQDSAVNISACAITVASLVLTTSF